MATGKSFAFLALLIVLVELSTITASSEEYLPLAPVGQFELLRSKRVRRAGASLPEDESIKEDENFLYTPTKPPDYDEEDDSNSTDHIYYKMTIKRGVDLSQYYINVAQWLDGNKSVVGEVKHSHLTLSYRKAASVKFRFAFPFYGHRLSNFTIATGGFCYVGDQTHSWLAATQYIAPLMANYDTLGDRSSIMYADDGEKMVVDWNNVLLRDNRKAGPFTFQTQLFRNGDIWFIYKEIPIPVRNISDSQHPCKAGVSDAYLFNHRVNADKASLQFPSHTRRIIHEYSRISVPMDDIRSGTVIVLTALPTCLNITTCFECHQANLANFQCSWCSQPDKDEGESAPFCSDQFGLNRRRQDWVETCAMETKQVYCDPSQSTNGSATSGPTTVGTTPGSGGGGGTVTATTPSSVIASSTESSKAAQKGDTPAESGGSGGFAFFTLLFIITLSCVGWVLYAFYNPHTPSGQLLIKYRPSRWQIPSSHVRYSASSMHM